MNVYFNNSNRNSTQPKVMFKIFYGLLCHIWLTSIDIVLTLNRCIYGNNILSSYKYIKTTKETWKMHYKCKVSFLVNYNPKENLLESKSEKKIATGLPTFYVQFDKSLEAKQMINARCRLNEGSNKIWESHNIRSVDLTIKIRKEKKCIPALIDR